MIDMAAVFPVRPRLKPTLMTVYKKSLSFSCTRSVVSSKRTSLVEAGCHYGWHVTPAVIVCPPPSPLG